LTCRIEEILRGQIPLFETDKTLEKVARNIASKLLARQQDHQPKEESDIREVDVNSIEMSRQRSVGCEHLTLEALRSLKLDKKLAELGFSAPQVALAIGSIIGSACFPASELATFEWLQERSGLGELIDFDYENTNLYKLYKISDKLIQKKKEIEEHLYEQERSLFSLHKTITLYDLTNTYFEGRALSNPLAKEGHSKEKRSDCPLVTLALVLDSSGFPKRSQIYEGSISEPITLSEMILKMQKGDANIIKPSIIMDAGIATEENIKWLTEHQYPYLVVSRKKHFEFDEKQCSIVKQNKNCLVRAKKVIDEETGEALLYCHSSQKEKKEKAMDELFSTRFETALNYLNEGLNIGKRLKKYDKIVEKIGRLKQQFPKGAKMYTVSVTKDTNSENALKINWKRKVLDPEPKFLHGTYCLRTSHKDWDEKTLWQTYTMLTDLEVVSRSLKSELGLRPIYHQKHHRVDGHLFITVLAYHLVHVIRCRLKNSQINDSWQSIRRIISPHSRVTVAMQSKNGETIHIRKSVRPEPEQQNIYSKLGFSKNPGLTVKTVISANNTKM
jgi:transposase